MPENPNNTQLRNASDSSAAKSAPSEPAARNLEDIFSETEKPKPAVFQPKSDAPLNIVEADDGYNRNSRLIFKKIVMILSALVALGAIGVGGYFSYKTFFKEKLDNFISGQKSFQPEEESSLETEAKVNNQADGGEQAPVDSNTAISPSPISGESTDNDNDGLSNEEEGRLNTDPNNPDSDEDGLFDREEVQVYQTDPMNRDTDGDSFSDGDEVKAQYNPKGTGKLFDIKTAN